MEGGNAVVVFLSSLPKCHVTIHRRPFFFFFFLLFFFRVCGRARMGIPEKKKKQNFELGGEQ